MADVDGVTLVAGLGLVVVRVGVVVGVAVGDGVAVVLGVGVGVGVGLVLGVGVGVGLVLEVGVGVGVGQVADGDGFFLLAGTIGGASTPRRGLREKTGQPGPGSVCPEPAVVPPPGAPAEGGTWPTSAAELPDDVPVCISLLIAKAPDPMITTKAAIAAAGRSHDC